MLSFFLVNPVSITTTNTTNTNTTTASPSQSSSSHVAAHFFGIIFAAVGGVLLVMGIGYLYRSANEFAAGSIATIIVNSL